MRKAAPWVVLGAVTAATALALSAIGFPSPTLFSALVIGLAAALIRPQAGLHLPRGVFIAAQAVCGVTLGAYLQSDALQRAHGRLAAGHTRQRGDARTEHGRGPPAGAFHAARRPDGDARDDRRRASGIVTMADDLGGDDRLVAFMQYLRVLVVVLLTPLLIAVLEAAARGASGPSPRAFGEPRDWLLTALIAPTAALLARRAHVPAGALLGPMIVAGIVALSGPGFAVPPVVRELSFALIGLQVGLRFTLETVRLLGRLFVPVLIALAGLLIGCAGLAVALYLATDVSFQDAYLATTPGVSTRCWRSPSARTRTRPSSSPSNCCGCWSRCCSRRSRCGGWPAW